VITASAAHAPACAIIHAAAFPPSEAWGAAAFTELLNSPGVRGLIEPCPLDGARGLVLVRQAADEAEILTLATLPVARRQGVARRLLAAALHWAAAAGARRVFLEVSEANAPARALYAAAGFTTCGRRPRYYVDGTDALVLQATLSPGG
jgi:ribosomal-protein-alanine N-acetyltransferase